MYSMACFNYLCEYEPNQSIYNQVEISSELNSLYDLMEGIKKYCDDNNIDLDDTSNIVSVKKAIESSIGPVTELYNKKGSHMSYIWLDEIIPVRITGSNAKILSINKSISEYNKNDFNRIISSCIGMLKNQGLYDHKTFDDILYIIFIDIIPKEMPTTIYFPDELYGDDE